MIVHNLNVKSVAPFVSEAQSPLIVDSNTPRPFSVASPCPQSIPRGAFQICNCFRRIEHLQLPFGDSGDRSKLFRCPIFKNRQSVLTPKAFYHIVRYITSNVIRQANNTNLRVRWKDGDIPKKALPGRVGDGYSFIIYGCRPSGNQ